MKKDWNKIMREIPSPDSSDAEDELNVLSVQKNAKRVCEMMHRMVPGLQRGEVGSVPKGMNDSNVILSSMEESFRSSFSAKEKFAARKISPPPPAEEGFLPSAEEGFLPSAEEGPLPSAPERQGGETLPS